MFFTYFGKINPQQDPLILGLLHLGLRAERVCITQASVDTAVLFTRKVNNR